MEFTEKITNFLLYMHKKGSITRDTQPFLDHLRFYFMVGYLQKNGVISTDGFTQERKKIWKLTDKGNKVTQHLFEIRKIMEEAK